MEPLLLPGERSSTLQGMVPLEWVLLLAAALFCIGLYGVLSRRNGIAALMGIELMLSAVGINLVAFWRYLDSETMMGQAFVLLVYATVIAQTALGLALIVAVHRTRGTIVLEDLDLLKESPRFPPYGED